MNHERTLGRRKHITMEGQKYKPSDHRQLRRSRKRTIRQRVRKERGDGRD